MNNRYGVDVPYFTKELASLSRSLDDRTPDELHRYLLRLADVALPSVKGKDSNDNLKCINIKCHHASFGCANNCKGYSPSQMFPYKRKITRLQNEKSKI
jgi:hypothetical protein